MAIETPSKAASTLPILSHWINGRPVEVLPEQTGPIYNPATGQVIGRVPRGGASEVDAAVKAARAAFPAWRDTPLIARSQVFFAYRELVWRHREEMAALITRDHGKTFPDAFGVFRPARWTGRPQANSTVSSPRMTSPRASGNVLP